MLFGSSDHLLRYLPLAIKLVALGQLALIQVGQGQHAYEREMGEAPGSMTTEI
jgi:hypothetical protein